jgi:hypothetical protein
MDIQGIVAELKQEASRIERAIAALVGLGLFAVREGEIHFSSCESNSPARF